VDVFGDDTADDGTGAGSDSPMGMGGDFMPGGGIDSFTGGTSMGGVDTSTYQVDFMGGGDDTTETEN